jgi:hypothetical protein
LADADVNASVAIALGFCGRARAGHRGFLVLGRTSARGAVLSVKAFRVGQEEGMAKPGVWYSLDDNDELMESEEPRCRS